jgi:hypothetical protein
VGFSAIGAGGGAGVRNVASMEILHDLNSITSIILRSPELRHI